MSNADSPDVVSEGAVSGNQASIPAAIRERANIRDGDKLRWYWADGELSVEIVRRRSGVFDEFDGFETEGPATNHDLVGIEPAGERDAGEPLDREE